MDAIDAHECAGDDWIEIITSAWTADLADSHQDIYTLNDGMPPEALKMPDASGKTQG